MLLVKHVLPDAAIAVRSAMETGALPASAASNATNANNSPSPPLGGHDTSMRLNTSLLVQGNMSFRTDGIPSPMGSPKRTPAANATVTPVAALHDAMKRLLTPAHVHRLRAVVAAADTSLPARALHWAASAVASSDAVAAGVATHGAAPRFGDMVHGTFAAMQTAAATTVLRGAGAGELQTSALAVGRQCRAAEHLLLAIGSVSPPPADAPSPSVLASTRLAVAAMGLLADYFAMVAAAGCTIDAAEAQCVLRWHGPTAASRFVRGTLNGVAARRLSPPMPAEDATLWMDAVSFHALCAPTHGVDVSTMSCLLGPLQRQVDAARAVLRRDSGGAATVVQLFPHDTSIRDDAAADPQSHGAQPTTAVGMSPAVAQLLGPVAPTTAALPETRAVAHMQALRAGGHDLVAIAQRGERRVHAVEVGALVAQGTRRRNREDARAAAPAWAAIDAPAAVTCLGSLAVDGGHAHLLIGASDRSLSCYDVAAASGGSAAMSVPVARAVDDKLSVNSCCGLKYGVAAVGPVVRLAQLLDSTGNPLAAPVPIAPVLGSETPPPSDGALAASTFSEATFTHRFGVNSPVCGEGYAVIASHLLGADGGAQLITATGAVVALWDVERDDIPRFLCVADDGSNDADNMSGMLRSAAVGAVVRPFVTALAEAVARRSLIAVGTDDGTVRLWDVRAPPRRAAATFIPPAAIVAADGSSDTPIASSVRVEPLRRPHQHLFPYAAVTPAPHAAATVASMAFVGDTLWLQSPVADVAALQGRCVVRPSCFPAAADLAAPWSDRTPANDSAWCAAIDSPDDASALAASCNAVAVAHVGASNDGATDEEAAALDRLGALRGAADTATFTGVAACGPGHMYVAAGTSTGAVEFRHVQATAVV